MNTDKKYRENTEKNAEKIQKNAEKKEKKYRKMQRKKYTYTRLASEGIFLGTNLSPRLAQSTVSPLQSHSKGQERRSSSSSDES